MPPVTVENVETATFFCIIVIHVHDCEKLSGYYVLNSHPVKYNCVASLFNSMFKHGIKLIPKNMAQNVLHPKLFKVVINQYMIYW